MALQAIEAAPKDENPVFLVDLDTSEMTTAHWAVRHGVSSQREGASIAPTHRRPGSNTFEGSRRSRRVLGSTSAAAGVCVLWFFIIAAADNGLCAESHIRAEAFVAPIEMEFKIAPPDTMRDESGRENSDILAGRLTPVPPGELDALRSAAQAVRTKQGQALDQERDRADALARELISLQAELDAARIVGSEEAVQAAAAEIQQMRALAQERDRAEALARELTSLRTELETSRAASLEAARTAEAATIEQTQAFEKERVRTGTLTSKLASARKEAEEPSAGPAAAHAAVLQVTETNRAIAVKQKLALASERDRADALARELTSVRNELEARNRQIAVLNAPLAVHSCEPAVDSSQIAAANLERSSASELPHPSVQSTAYKAASDLDPKVVMAMERFTSASAASRSPVREQRLPAWANALLQQADISGARPLLEHAIERGSIRAALMPAETYDAHVRRSWPARGISDDLTKARDLHHGRRQAASRMRRNGSKS
jgi:hypothetical protein